MVMWGGVEVESASLGQESRIEELPLALLLQISYAFLVLIK